MKKILLTIPLILLLPVWAGAATYYVKQTAAGGDTGADCANAKSLTWFNANASAGDTAIMCDGTFTTTISPTNSGTSGNPITYIAENQYAAVITTSSYGTLISGDDYITVDGLYYNNIGWEWISIDAGADHIIVQNCKFYDAFHGYGIHVGHTSATSDISFLDNIFSDAPDGCEGEITDRNNPNTMIFLGQATTRVRIEGNYFGDNGLTGIGAWGNIANVLIKNNKFRNKMHYGLSLISNQHDFIVEGNDFWDSGLETADCCSVSATGKDDFAIGIGSHGCIYRGNRLWDNDVGIWFYTTAEAQYAADNRIYHNTNYSNTERDVSLYQYYSYAASDNIFKNNVFSSCDETDADAGGQWNETEAILGGYSVVVDFYPSSNPPQQGPLYFDNNWFDTGTSIKHERTDVYALTSGIAALEAAESEYTNNLTGSTAGFTDAVNDDFTLQSNSVLIDAAKELTLTDSTGGGGTDIVTVDDATYFFDGNSIPGATADYIYIEDTGKVQILSVDSATQITLTANATWADNKKIYWCPDGVCYSGSAPDIGAYEYGGTPQNNPPTITAVLPGGTELYADGGASWNEISCSSTIADSDGTIATRLWDFGIEYITDGTMEDNPTTNWTAVNTTLSVETTIKYSGTNSLKVTDEGSGSGARQTIVTEIGAKYRVSGYVYNNNCTGIIIAAGTTTGDYDLGYQNNIVPDLGSWLPFTFDFTATGTTTYISLGAWGTPEDGSLYGFFDNVTMRMISTVEDPGTVTYPDPGSYPTAYTVTINATDDLGASATQQSFTVTIQATQDLYADILFWWRCEGVNLDANLDHYTSDGTAELQGTAAINTDAHNIGTNGLDCATGGDSADFLAATDSDCNPAEGNIAAWIKIPTWLSGCPILRVMGTDTANQFSIVMEAADDLKWLWTDGGSVRATWLANNSGLSDGGWHFVELEWDTVANTREIKVDNVSIDSGDGNRLAAIDDFAVPVTSIEWGLYTGCGVSVVYQDNIMISNDKDRDFYALRNSTQYPGYAKLGIIGTTEQDKTYGIDGSLSVPIFFVDGSGNPKAITWTDAALPYGYLLTETGATDLRLYHSSPATTVAASTHWFSTHATDANYVNSMIAAGMASADLTVSSIVLEGGTFDADMTIPTGENLADNAAIVIDTTAPSISAFFHCDSAKAQINIETTYVAGETCYLCVQSDGDTIFFNDGPLSNVKIGTNMSYPDKEEFEYYTGIGTAIIQFARVIQVWDSDLDLQAEGTADGTGLIHGATILIDSGSNEVTYTLPQADPAGGNIIISAPGTSASPLTVGTGGAIAKISNREILDDDFYQYLSPVTDDVDLTGFDGVIISGIGRTQVNTGTMTFGTNCHVRCVNFSGAVTGAGANGNTYHPVCQKGPSRMGMNPN